MVKNSAATAASARPNDIANRVLIICEIRFIRESLAEVLPRKGNLLISGLAADLQEALGEIAHSKPDIVLLDEAFPDGLSAARRIREDFPETPVVVIAVAETAKEVIAWARAGVSGYIPRTAGLAEIVPLLHDIMRGEQSCSRSVAAGLLRGIAENGAYVGKQQDMTSTQSLTAREGQIAQLVAVGMSNKEIARRLNIGLATTKTHVHHLLGKLNLQGRGQAASWIRGQRNP